jgi:alpha-glucosidase
MTGSFGYETDVQIKNITLLGANGQQTLQGPIPLTGEHNAVFDGADSTNPPPFEGVASRSSLSTLIGTIAGAAWLAL